MKHTGHGDKFTRLREQAIAALLETTTVSAAAQRVGIDESTLRAWLKYPEFADDYRAARRAVITRAVDRLAHVCTDAVDHLVDVMAHSENDGSRVSASKAVLDYAFKTVELDELTARITRLEKAAGAANSSC